jgi:RNase H-like domain found in reverse transcriptase/Reverse transcriptase (RNA-dependent DNA polymerase)/Integrase zinc binding domain/Integrase core domain/Chromo (CHRromatin Organisation MOdifier) domain/Retroviral aspartyl protease
VTVLALGSVSKTRIPPSRQLSPVIEHLVVSVRIHFENKVLDVQAMIDSGANASFIDVSFAKHHQLPLELRPEPATLALFDGEPSSAGKITHTCRLRLSLNLHHEDLILEVSKSGHYPIVLGYPWLRTHNPQIDWQEGTISFHSPYCYDHCRAGSSTPSGASAEPIPASPSHDSPTMETTSSATRVPPVHLVHAAAFLRTSSQALFSGMLQWRSIPSVVTANATSSASPTHSTLTTTPDPLSAIPEKYRSFEDLKTFSKVVADTLPPHRPYDHAIELEPGTSPPFGPIYSLSATELHALREYLDENLAKGFIRPSTSPAGAPILFVKKKDGGLRLCVDYRGLNKITRKNKYAIPLINELRDRLHAARIFTKLDIRNAYYNIRIRQDDEWKTAFRTRYGSFEYRVMPFGLTNAPATFQHFMNDIFRDLLDQFVVVYLDDILVFSENAEQHEEHVRTVLKRLRDNGLALKAEKCEFDVDTVEFLGYVISPDGVTMDRAKVDKILSWPEPRNAKDIQRFLGLANYYRRFIRSFSKIAAPLTRLLRKNVPFQMGDAARSAFQELKTAFTTAPVLIHFDPSKPIVVETDASDYALGAVASQQAPDGKLHPFAFHSRALDPAERNYEIHDKELLGIVDAFRIWRHYLEGAQHCIQVFTDHKSLEYFTSTKQLNRRQARWSIFLSGFDFTIVYRPGKHNHVPDALSRRADLHPGGGKPLDENPHNQQVLLPREKFTVLDDLDRVHRSKTHGVITSSATILAIDPDLKQLIVHAAQNDPEYCTLLERAESDQQGLSIDKNTGLLLHNSRIVVPNDVAIKSRILQQKHDSLLSGHPGRHRTLLLVQNNYTWPGMRKFVDDYVKSCDRCARTKTLRQAPYGYLKSLPIPERPWSSISMDFIEELPASGGFDSILVVVDRLTKMAHFLPCQKSMSAEQLAKLYVEHIFRLHGTPLDIVSDRGTKFTSRFWRAFTSRLNIASNFSTAYHPQSDGQTERVNQVLEQYLRSYIHYRQDDWAALIPLAEFAYNSAPHSSTKVSPFFANYGFEPTIDVATSASTTTSSLKAEDLLTELRVLHESLKRRIRGALQQHAKQYDKHRKPAPEYRPGDLVWLSSRNIPTTRPSRKLADRYLGPFPVERKISTHAYRLRLPSSMRIHPVFHVALLKPYVSNQIQGRIIAPPPPVQLDDGSEEYEVEEILDSRQRRGKKEYLVSYVGFGPDHDLWLPLSDLGNSQELVDEFEQRQVSNTATARRPSRRRRQLAGARLS